MCGILAVNDPKISEQTFAAALGKLAPRGPDMSRIEKSELGWLGFQRLAIMDLNASGMQPFHLGRYDLVCNGEIYPYRRLRQELEDDYSFISTSDCEVILPLYRQDGAGAFGRLGSEFALVIFDHERGEVLAARDPIGIRPLFYGYTAAGQICFASEAKALSGFAKEIHPFPPGHYYRGGKFIRYCDLSAVPAYSPDSREEAAAKIHGLLEEAVAERLDADAPIGFLLSGGLDSSLVCAIAQRELRQPIRTFAIGMAADAIDLRYARLAAAHIGSRHTEFLMTPQEVIEALPEVIRADETWDITTIRASLGMYLLCKKIHAATDIKVLFTGEISDELFGYKYTDYAPSPEAFQAEAGKRIRELYAYDVLRADRCLSANSLEGRVPFGDSAFVRYVMSIDPRLKMNTYGMGKYLLRQAFREGGYLPKRILFRDKAAFSDAVGHSLVDDLKAYAEAAYTDADYEARRQRYDWCRPYTKESLLYREIFEGFYPGQGRLIPAYWLPNQDWPGCQVSDPSARVLANYGKSGE